MSNILLIEQDPENAQAMGKILQDASFAVEIATTGEDGMAKLIASKPGLVILDDQAPGKNGKAFLEEVRANFEIGFVPVLVISDTANPQEYMDLGACDIMSRSQINPETMLAKVQKCFAIGGGSLNVGQAGDTAPLAAPGGSATGGKTKSAGPKKRVLIIEDDQFLSELSQTKLSKAGYEVMAALDGETGLQTAINQKPDIILLDILLPGIDGFQVLSQLKSNPDPQINGIPVLLLSNYGQEENIQKGMSLGAVDYLVKANFTTNEIVTKLQAVLDGKKSAE